MTKKVREDNSGPEWLHIPKLWQGEERPHTRTTARVICHACYKENKWRRKISATSSNITPRGASRCYDRKAPGARRGWGG